MACSQFPRRLPRSAAAVLLGGIVLTVLPQAHATNLFNVYAGAAYARANVRAKDANRSPFSGSGPLESFNRSDSGYQFSLGVRGLDLLGAEVDYFNLGSGSVSHAFVRPAAVAEGTLSQKGEAAFAMLYLPVPIIDIYLKAGVDRITSDLGAQYQPFGLYCPVGLCSPESLALHATTTGLALGAGAQWKFGNWGVRAEYERFTALGEHPDLVSVGLIWTFL